MTASHLNLEIPIRRVIGERPTLAGLPVPTRTWFEAHLIAPKILSAAFDLDGAGTDDVWLITDHSGANDSPYRVYFDESTNRFGRERLLNTGASQLLNSLPSLFAVLDNII